MPTISPTDAVAAIKSHHAELHAGIRDRVAALSADVREGKAFGPAHSAVVAYLDTEIVPHAQAEEQTLYRAADSGPAAMLVDAMRGEHRDMIGRLEQLRGATDPVDAATGASAILALFESHLGKENDRLLPVLVGQPGVSLGDLLEGMHELVG